ncbi:hypothetical protein MDAP_002666 [Mitosporidium daphniae]
MTFVPVLDILLFHTSSEPQLLYRHAKTTEESFQNTDLLFGGLQSLRVFCGRIKELQGKSNAHPSSQDSSAASKVLFNSMASSFKSFKTPFYSLYFFESATGFQIILVVGQPVETQTAIRGPYCRTNILDAGCGEGSQVILQHFYKSIIVNEMFLDARFVGLDFSNQNGKSWNTMIKEDFRNMCDSALKGLVDKFLMELPKL